MKRERERRCVCVCESDRAKMKRWKFVFKKDERKSIFDRPLIKVGLQCMT